MIPWRRSYEPFKGDCYEYGLYCVVASRDHYDVTHGGKRFGSFTYFTDAEDAIRNHISNNS
jgi:hypothetical protein